MVSSYGPVTECNDPLKCLEDQDDKGAVVANLIYAFWLCTDHSNIYNSAAISKQKFSMSRQNSRPSTLGLSHGQME